MTEDDARTWLRDRFGVAAVALLARFADEIIAENGRQNLIAPSTVDVIWTRHIVDSAQLLPLAASGMWVDIGSGAGFPGMVAAILGQQPMLLIEPRRQRAAFLNHCRELLDMKNVRVAATKIEVVNEPAAVISARAVATVEKLLQAGAGCATKDTRWLLPRGRMLESELAAIRRRWGGMFHMKQSLTDPASAILVCDGPYRR